MRRVGGVIPPGKAGLIMLAVALAPVAIKACKPLGRAAGRFLKKTGEIIEDIVSNSTIDAKPTEAAQATEVAAEAPMKAKPKNSKKGGSKKPKSADATA